jgi:hypothetical protein
LNQRLQTAIEAYRDGELSPRRSRAAERTLAQDGEARNYLRSGEALSRLVRESWSEGPTSPPPERFLAAIRPELARIDAERARRAAERAPARWLAGWADWLRPLPLGGVGAFAGAAAAAVIALQGGWFAAAPQGGERFGSESLRAFASAQSAADEADALLAEDTLLAQDALLSEDDVEWVSDGYVSTARAPFSSHTSIYDVHQGDAGLLIYDGEDDSPVLIFALPDEEGADGVLFERAVLGGSES